jgi:chain length determinant protein EpsF
VLLILRLRWVLALSVFAAVLLLAILVTWILPDQYTGTASVVIDTNPDPTSGQNSPGSDALLTTLVTTEVDIISSERVARQVVKTVHLDQSPSMEKKWRSATGGVGDIDVWLGNYVRTKKLVVTPTRGSNVIEISVDWYDRDTAAALANAFAQFAIDTNIELKVEPAKLYAGWFRERSRALRADLEEKQKRLSDFQKSTGIIATDEKVDVENARLAELSTQLSAIQEARQESQSHQRQAGVDSQALPEVLSSPVIQSLKESLSQAESREPDIAARLGKNHPDYQAVESQIATLREKIAQETAKITASLGNTTQVNVHLEADIRRAVEAQKEKVLLLKHQHDESAVLQDDVASAQRDLDAVTEKYAQSTLENLTPQTNVVQLTVASPPVGRSSPRLLLALALGVLFGISGGVGAAVFTESLDKRLRTDGELAALLGVPVLGRLRDALAVPAKGNWGTGTFRKIMKPATT